MSKNKDRAARFTLQPYLELDFPNYLTSAYGALVDFCIEVVAV